MEHTLPYDERDPRLRVGSPRLSVGAMIVGIGALHQLVGVLFGLGVLRPHAAAEVSAPLLDIARGGLVGAVEPYPERLLVFWFLVSGFGLLATGWLAHVLERRGPGLPRAFAPALFLFSLISALLIPVSGFWLGLLPAAVAYRRKR